MIPYSAESSIILGFSSVRRFLSGCLSRQVELRKCRKCDLLNTAELLTVLLRCVLRLFLLQTLILTICICNLNAIAIKAEHLIGFDNQCRYILNSGCCDLIQNSIKLLFFFCFFLCFFAKP